jgi:transglutaminase-like putative cysteine protease
MHRTARTFAVSVPALVVVAAAWLRLEHPLAPLWRVLALITLALVATAPRRRLWRFVAAAASTVVAAWIAVGITIVPSQLLDPGSGFGLPDAFSALGARFGSGFSDFYSTHLPFDPRVHAAMGELVLAGIFTFSLGFALLVAARKPVGSALALLVGAGWPATLLGPSHGVAIGAAILGAELVVLAGLGSRRVPVFAVPAAAVMATAAVAVGSATAARHGLVHWQSWNLTHSAGGPVNPGFAWDAQYDGLHWPAHPTVLLEVQTPHAPSYLRAAVLDDFRGDAWSIGAPRAADALEPAAALQPRNETREVVTVNGLADNRLVGESVPVRFDAGGAPLVQPERGFASLREGFPPGFRYTAWSYTSRATATDLQRSAPAYPATLADEGLLDVGGGVRLPPFGTSRRAAAVTMRLLHNPALYPYLPLARLAQQVAGHARTPYGAVVRLERWFVTSGGFSYSDHPLVVAPPLVGFVMQTHAGYCQFFAGAMALMLRYLGIPARVAVGFAGGTYSASRHVWLITDRDAHAWVEVWFRGYGWLPFDPTPPAPGSPRRPTVAGADVSAGGAGPAPNPFGSRRGAATARTSPTVADLLLRKNRIFGPHSGAELPASAVRSGGSSGRGRLALILLLGIAAAAGSIVLTKGGFRAIRRIRRDPRRVAAACRQELVGFLVDQRIHAPRSATLAELGGLVQHEFGIDPGPFVAAATAARFGRTEDGAAAARTARRELRVALAGARRCLTRWERLRGLFSLRSLARPSSAVDASASLGSTGS